MVLIDDNESGFSSSDIHFARQTFYRDCPNGRCSKRKFLTFIRKSCSLQKPLESNIHLIQIFQNHRQSKKFFSLMFDIYDRNHDGELDFDEYLYALSAISGANRLRTIETLFQFFDRHNQGYITREEFNSRKKLASQFLGQYKTGIQKNLLFDKAFNAMDLDQDGRISKEEFIQWYLKDHSISEETKPIRRRTRLLKNLSTFVDIRGQIKTSSLQQENKNPLETAMNINNNQELFSTVHADRYLLKIFRRARDRFHHEKNYIHENQSDSGIFTASSRTTFLDDDDDDDDSNSLFDIDEDDCPSISTDKELLCQSLEDILIQTLIELRQQRKGLNSNHINISIKEDEQSIKTRL